jgi:hypothetical protein
VLEWLAWQRTGAVGHLGERVSTVKLVGIALAAGVGLVGIAAVVALFAGRHLFYPIVAGIAIAAMLVGFMMSRGADVRRPPGVARTSAADYNPRSPESLRRGESRFSPDANEVVDEAIESRRRSGWLFLAAAPAVLVTVVHYLL